MDLKNISYIQEKENLEGRKELALIIDCTKCTRREVELVKDNRCLRCLFSNLFFYKDKKLKLISLLDDELLIESNQVAELLDYYKKLKKISKIIQKIKNTRDQKCKFEEFKCEIFLKFVKLYNLDEYKYYNPIYLYNLISNLYSESSNFKLNNTFCQKCQEYLKNLLLFLLEIFNNLDIIKKFQKFKNENISFYEHIFLKPGYLINKKQKHRELNILVKKEPLVTYNIENHRVFQVSIYQASHENEKLYQIIPFFKGDEEDYLKKVIRDIIYNLEIGELEKIIPLDALIDLYRNESIKFIKSKFKFTESKIEKISFFIALKKLHLHKIFPLLTDDLIEEIFLDSPEDEIYINHQTFGRCRTGIQLKSKEIERIKTMFRLYSGKRLDYMNPSIKLVMKNKYFYCRFAIDVQPIQIHNFSLDIRKLNRNIFTIQDLLKNETLNPPIAAFLYFNILRKRNITITGETDTGKTTLINSLDLLTPKEFRKIYVENITESLKQLEFGNHQLKYRVDSLGPEKSSNNYSKSNIIKTLLHRTPDIIYLGEILTKEEAEAMFHCLASGLRGFQTIHADNVNSLINRFLYHFKIDKSCLYDLDLVILMKKDINKRRVISISEVIENNEQNLYDPIFKYEPLSQKWKLLKPLYSTKVLNEVSQYESLTKEKFLSFLNVYNEIFEFISNINKLNIKEHIELFHKISYYSLVSIDSLKNFWNKWKNKRNLNL
ncbi:MAG: ATPase, T2SS/T4P/T4SS family [Candidatus Thorarchaeota archaeon]